MRNKVYVGTAYYPEHWPKERWKIDVQLMKEAGIDALRIAELAWSFLEPEDGKFNFVWLDEFIEIAYKEGIEVIIGTPSEATPTWMNFKYPEIIAMDEIGNIHGGRGKHCYNSPALIHYTERLVSEMAKHYASNPAVIGWQIDNELRGAKCFCHTCTEMFRKWLKKRYGSLENLNEEWGTRFWSQIYNIWDEVKFPSTDQLTVSLSQKLDHFRFTSDSAVEYLNLQVDVIKKYAPHQFVTHNAMGLSPWLNAYDLAKKLDFLGWDTYPNVDDDNFGTCAGHDITRGATLNNFWVMEQKNGFLNYSDYNLAIEPGLVRLWAYQDIARGADGVMFYRWRAGRYSVEQNPNGILRHDGSPRRAYYEIKQLTEELNDFGNELVGTKVKADVAIIYSYDVNWALETKKQYKNFDYKEHLMSYYRAVTGMGLTADLVDPLTDLSQYKVVIAPTLLMISSAIAENLNRYVSEGGYLVVSAMSGIKTWANVVIDTPWPGLLAELAGIVVDEFEVIPDRLSNTVVYKDKEYEVRSWLDIIEPKTAQSIATYGGKFYAGRTAVSKNKYEKGTVLYLGAMGNGNLVEDILADVFEECRLSAVSLPQGIFITVRVGNKDKYTFIINIGNKMQKVCVKSPGTDMISKRYISGEACIKPMDLLIIRSPISDIQS